MTDDERKAIEDAGWQFGDAADFLEIRQDDRVMVYKGYIGVSEVDDEAGVIRGKVVNTRDTITFQGESVEAARTAFRASVDDYLDFCKNPDDPETSG